MRPSASVSASPVLSPSTRYRVNTRRIQVVDCRAGRIPGEQRGVNGSKDNSTVAGAIERCRSPGAVASDRLRAPGEGRAMTAVETQNLSTGQAPVHLIGNERGRDRRPTEQSRLRVLNCQEQVAAIVSHAVCIADDQRKFLAPWGQPCWAYLT